MIMAKHTPGPWRVSLPDETTVCTTYTVGKGQMFIASVEGEGNTYEVWPERLAANARLIAAAPEMLEALRAMLDGLRKTFPATAAYPEGDYLDTMPHMDEPVLLAEEAIAKVEG